MYQKPSASMIAQSPWTHVPGHPRPVRLEVALVAGSRQKPRVMPGSGARTTSSPTSPRTGRPSSSTTSAAIPRHGPLNEVGLIGLRTLQPTMPADDLRPARVVDDRQPPAADLAEAPPPGLGIPRLAGRAEHPQRATVVRADRAPRRGP